MQGNYGGGGIRDAHLSSVFWAKNCFICAMKLLKSGKPFFIDFLLSSSPPLSPSLHFIFKGGGETSIIPIYCLKPAFFVWTFLDVFWYISIFAQIIYFVKICDCQKYRKRDEIFVNAFFYKAFFFKGNIKKKLKNNKYP